MVADYSPGSISPVKDTPAPVAVRSRTVRLANGVNLYYNDAGDLNNPTILLLHGFPTSSNYFRNLIPLLASSAYNFRVIAPDLPGFGTTVCPETYNYSFQKLAETVVLFLDAIDIGNFALYCMGEYGTLVALKVIQFKMENILGLIIQNGTVYNESRLDSSVLDIFKTGLFSPSLSPHSNSMLGTAMANNYSEQKFGQRSLASSLRSSRRNSNSSLSSETSEDPERRSPFSLLANRNSSHVSFSLSVDEYVIDGSNSVRVSTSRTPSVHGDDEEDTENEDEGTGAIVANHPMVFISTDGTQSPRPNKVLSQPSIEQVKAFYLPSQTKRPEFSFNFSFNRDMSNACTLDSHAYTFDYSLMLRPGQGEIQKQLYSDYLANRKPIPLSSPTSMWLRTTNTPILILWGTNDPLLSQSMTIDNFKRDCRHCQVKTLDNGGHCALEYYPDEIAAEIFKFFSLNQVKPWSAMTY